MILSEPVSLDAGAGDALAGIPDLPGVFVLHAQQGAPYLGRTRVLRRRLTRLLGVDRRPSRLLSLGSVVIRADYWRTGSALESSVVFHMLARCYFPETYLKISKLRMPPWVRVILSNAFPRTQVTSRLAGRGVFYGPFRSRGAAELFESQMLDLFQIRRCQEDLTPSPEHPGCMYGEMNLCLRPCQQAVGVEEYATEVHRVVEFLESGGRSLVQPMQAARERSSEAMEFEEAARLHKRLDKIEATLKLRDELVRPVDALDGVAVAGGIEAGTVSLSFMRQGVWQPVVRFAVQAESDRPVSMDSRLRAVVNGVPSAMVGAGERQEHVALLARWFYSSWCDGEWIPFDGPERVPYRKLVGAVHRVAARSS